ncbi:MAG: hypothetical protein K6T66_14610 [Peptococcaceae bacterium]|nr:hypothetical protein [Peptococcaceae bacterium]
MLKRILTLAVVMTLLAGFYLFPAEAGNEKLQRILQITGLPSEIGGLKARLDRDMLVYGLPSDIPDNDWKTEAQGVTTSWQEANGIDLGHPGKQEPRYLGRTSGGNLLASDYFPDDAPNHVAPARRDMIDSPWKKGLCYGTGLTISDYSWGVIVRALMNYHELIGHPGPGNGFAGNPAFYGNFSKETLKDYFLVMAEPRPGIAGAVRHWHYRHDLGGIWYDPIFIRWDVLPNFIVKSIDPGTDKARPGETYTGKVVLKAVPDGSFVTDPVTYQLFDTMNEELKLARNHVVPFGIAVNGQFVPLNGFQPVEGLSNIYQYRVPAGTKENVLEVPFQWTAAGGNITIAAGVNESVRVLPRDTWGYMDWSEITNIDNTKAVEVALEGQYDVKVQIIPDKPKYTAFDSDSTMVSFKAVVTRKDDTPGTIKVRAAVSTPVKTYTLQPELGPGESVEYPMAFRGGTGCHTVEGDAWPDGLADIYPGDNHDSAVMCVEYKTFKTDSKIRVDIIDR